jgi:hypothetical protein
MDGDWMPVEGVDDDTMIRHAAERRKVKLANGQVVTLVRWPGGRKPIRHHHGRSVRVETHTGSRFKAAASAVVEVFIDSRETP